MKQKVRWTLTVLEWASAFFAGWTGSSMWITNTLTLSIGLPIFIYCIIAWISLCIITTVIQLKWKE